MQSSNKIYFYNDRKKNEMYKKDKKVWDMSLYCFVILFYI